MTIRNDKFLLVLNQLYSSNVMYVCMYMIYQNNNNFATHPLTYVIYLTT